MNATLKHGIYRRNKLRVCYDSMTISGNSAFNFTQMLYLAKYLSVGYSDGFLNGTI